MFSSFEKLQHNSEAESTQAKYKKFLYNKQQYNTFQYFSRRHNCTLLHGNKDRKKKILQTLHSICFIHEDINNSFMQNKKF